MTEELAFMKEDKETIRRGNAVIDRFFSELEKEGFTVQQTKNIVTRINARITSASIACDMRTQFKKELTEG